VRARIAVLILIASLPACASAREPVVSTPPAFSVLRLSPAATPSPELHLQVQAGHVQALIPGDWEARPLPTARYPQEGFIAGPMISEWARAAGTVGGMEAFWVDVAKLRIPSDYYYLAARGPAIRALTRNQACRSAEPRVFVDHPPDFAGRNFSPGDYVARARGTCTTEAGSTRWEYVVAAPGFGPIRRVGIPNSGLYVLIVAATGPGARVLVRDMIESTRFGESTLSQIVDAAGTPG
jgi:hypothetical protein